VLVLDLPGFGGSESPPDAWGLDGYATFVGRLLTKLSLRPYAILGHSNGGAIAVHGLATGVLAADRLVLLASAGIRSTDQGRKQLWKAAAKAGKLLSAPLPAAAKRRLRRKLYTAAGSDMLVVEHLQASFKLVVRYDIQHDAERVDIPVLLIYGEADDQTPPAYGRLLHEHFPHSTLELIGGAGHFLHLEQPAKVLALVSEFLS
jgi:pimeloyl-ACP methyl ester carboxylesterase